MSLKKKFDTGEFTILAETETPKGVDISVMVEKNTKIKEIVDAFVVPDMPNAVMKMSSLAASIILHEKGMETIMQICCRDRNRLALQGDLLGAFGCGIRNIMAVDGHDSGLGDHHEALTVNDINLIELLETVKTLHEGRDMAGIELEGSPCFLPGAALMAGAEDIALELDEMSRKIEAGAEFFITSPIFELERIMPFLEKAEQEKVKIIPTVILLKSMGMARYMARNVKHIHIPDELIKRLQKSKDKSGECLSIASELVSGLKEKGFSGALLSVMGQEDKISEILK